MKHCNRCKTTKDISLFRKRSDKPGYVSFCKECNSKRTLNWQKENPDRVKARHKHRQEYIKQRTPVWLTKEEKAQIQTEYDLAKWCTKVMQEKYTVDHIVPLKGKTVSGLHVPWNLQVIPAKANFEKHAKFE